MNALSTRRELVQTKKEMTVAEAKELAFSALLRGTNAIRRSLGKHTVLAHTPLTTGLSWMLLQPEDTTAKPLKAFVCFGVLMGHHAPGTVLTIEEIRTDDGIVHKALA